MDCPNPKGTEKAYLARSAEVYPFDPRMRGLSIPGFGPAPDPGVRHAREAHGPDNRALTFAPGSCSMSRRRQGRDRGGEGFRSWWRR